MHNDHTIAINHLYCDSLSGDFDGNHLFCINHSIVIKNEELELFSVERQLINYQ
jgi:hypothetical protein